MASTKKLHKEVEADLDKLLSLCDKYAAYMQKADPTNTSEVLAATRRLFKELNSINAKQWEDADLPVKVDVTPIPKEKISKVADFILQSKPTGVDEDLHSQLQDKMTTALNDWLPANGKFREMADSMEKKPNVETDAFSEGALAIRGALETFSGKIPEDRLKISRQAYAESLIRYVNTSLK